MQLTIILIRNNICSMRSAAAAGIKEGLDMYVCVCNAVSDRQIRDAVDHGARSLFEVQCQLPVGACCGRCEDTASKVVPSTSSPERSALLPS